MNIVLAALNSKYIHFNLAIRYIKSYCNEYNIKLFEGTINENLIDISMNILKMEPEILGFSCYIWNIEETLKVCSIIKSVRKDVKIILGGPEVSFNGEEILKKNEYIDFIIEGEGELTFKELIDSLYKKKSLNNIKGIIFKDGEKIIKNEKRELIEDINVIPFPYGDEVLDKIVYYEASRGCPFNCSYCLSSTIKGVRFFNIDRVKKDLKFFIDNKVKLVKFVDRTFNANKKFAKEIWKFLIENTSSTTFHFEISADLLDKECLEILSLAPPKLFQFEIGVQTTNLEVLKKINRIMDFSLVESNVKKIKEFNNIHCHLDLIAGLPGEDIKSFKRSFDMCMKIKPDVLQLGFLKILKGSPIEKEVDKYNICYLSFPPYQVLSTKDISYKEINTLKKLEKVFDIYYNSGNFRLTIGYILDMVNSQFDFFEEFSNYLENKGFYCKNFDLKDKFLFIYDFLLQKFDKELIKDLLLHDYVLTTKKPSLPEFLIENRLEKEKNQIIMHNKEKICKEFSKDDFKKVICFKVNYAIFQKNDRIEVKNKDAYLFLNTENGRYFYV